MLNLLKLLEKPQVFEKTTSLFWDDEHISKGMLEAHLNPVLDAASRPHEIINKSIEWIYKIAPSKEYNKVLDLGCGPGLYCEKFHLKGYEVTGIDYSKRSIEYAKNKAIENNHTINYIYKSYLEMDYKNEFDLITLIYCDYSVLADNDRIKLLNKIYNSLKKEGKFIFDVFTPENFKDKKEGQSWYVSDGGFWKPNKHLCLEAHYIYDNDVRLDQYVIIDKDENIDVIRNWFKAFTKEAIIEEVKKVGFSKIKFYKNVMGDNYSNDSQTICLVLEK